MSDIAVGSDQKVFFTFNRLRLRNLKENALGQTGNNKCLAIHIFIGKIKFTLEELVISESLLTGSLTEVEL